MTAYLDSSAAVKLVVREAESDALGAWIRQRSRLVSSALLRTELIRAVRRGEPAAMDRARATIARFNLHGLDPAILDLAGRLDPTSLRSLDAIHLATALRLTDELEAIVTYDRRMIAGAQRLGLPVASPA
ncbi:MAG: type II toxin-antitoxin system VapC family toxin [Candidatus Limnocylindria bacterium]